MTDIALPLVPVTHTMPDWIRPQLEAAFALCPVDEQSPVPPGVGVLLTHGPSPVSNALLDRMPDLKLIVTVGSGTEGIDVAYAASRGIVVSNSASATADDVADHAITLMLALNVRLPAMHAAIVADAWPDKPVHRSLAEQKIGIVGLGGIGQGVAARLAAFGPEMRWTGPHPRPVALPYVADLGELADWADILLISARADSSNIGLIDAALLDRLGPEGLLVNVSRGSIVDEPALIAALRAGRLGGAALDVFAPEPTSGARWQGVPNIVLTPHIGGLATGTRRRITERVIRVIRGFVEGGVVPV